MRIRELVDIHYPNAQKIVLVMDNLNTHTPSSLYSTFAPPEAYRILRKLEIHYTPVQCGQKRSVPQGIQGSESGRAPSQNL